MSCDRSSFAALKSGFNERCGCAFRVCLAICATKTGRNVVSRLNISAPPQYGATFKLEKRFFPLAKRVIFEMKDPSDCLHQSVNWPRGSQGVDVDGSKSGRMNITLGIIFFILRLDRSS